MVYAVVKVGLIKVVASITKVHEFGALDVEQSPVFEALPLAVLAQLEIVDAPDAGTEVKVRAVPL